MPPLTAQRCKHSSVRCCTPKVQGARLLHCGEGRYGSRRAYVLRIASDSCRKRAVPALTFSANSGRSQHSETATRSTGGQPRNRRRRDCSVTRLCQELWASPETAAIRIAPSTKPTMPIGEKIKLCQAVKRLRSGSLKYSVNSLLISITGKSRERLAPKHQIGPCCVPAGTLVQRAPNWRGRCRPPNREPGRCTADAESRAVLKDARPNVVPSLFCLAFAHATEVTDLVGGVAVAHVRQCGGELRVGSRAVVGIAPCPFGPTSPFLARAFPVRFRRHIRRDG